ncbi:predicted protein [Naegleria gruberi]|uniref:Predicted protein n=1 Tax=Naegleria gruberi TaxID=5762 RepID=D2V4L2_NAEGR|nr:uncharacterized protein NAEGRDRAFT_46687 [Naegleria gruberi]EFC47954.1 predicted protein [Naegleria gruberi]|eukprot:XP_002680698.1 predicted protein [Naegleria gruberi strain NEG-M]
MEDKPYDYYPPPPPRYSTGKEYGRVNNNKPNNPNTNTNHNNNKRLHANNQHTEQHNKPSEKIGTTNTTNNSITRKPQFENKRKITVDMQPNKKQKQAVPTSKISTEKTNEKIVNNSNSNNKNEDKSSDEKLDIYRVLRVCAENSSADLTENEIFKYFPNALKVRMENQRDFLVEFSSLVDMIPYIESETLQEEETVNISIPKSLIPPEYANNTQKLVLEFIDFLKQKQPQSSSNGSAFDPSNWNKLISSIKIPQNVSPYELLEFRERRVKKVLGKKEFGILIHDKPKITDKIGFPLFSNPNMTDNRGNERFFFFAFCKTGTTFLGKEEISKCFPNAKAIHFDPGDHRIIVELNNQNDFNAYKKISHSGKLLVRNHSFLLRKANPKDIPPDILNPPLQQSTDIPTVTQPSSEESKNASTPDKNLLLQQLRQQMDHPSETPKQDPKELRNALLAQMKTQPSSVESLESFISLSDPESESSSEEDEMIEETEEDVRSYSSSESNNEEAPSSPQHPTTPNKTQLLSALREQMQQSAEKKKEPTPSTTSVSASSSNILGIKRKTFASHYALFHPKFNK